jgi:hypothetical protein
MGCARQTKLGESCIHLLRCLCLLQRIDDAAVRASKYFTQNLGARRWFSSQTPEQGRGYPFRIRQSEKAIRTGK